MGQMDMMIKNKVLPLILLFVAITLLASCTAERGQEPGSGNVLTGLSLRITPDNPRVEEILRANEVGTETENKIEKVDVFIFDQAGTTLVGSALGQTVTAGATGTISVTVDQIPYKGTGRTFQVAVVANAEGAVTYPSLTGLTLDGLSSLSVMKTDDTARPPLVMYGTAELNANPSGIVTGEVRVKRLAAAIELRGEGEISIGETYLVNAPKGATLAGDPLTGVATLTSTTTHATGERAYVYPTASKQRAYVVFKAKNPSGVDNYYFFSPKDGSQPSQSLTANTLYRVTIKKLTADGYDTLDAAVAAIRSGEDRNRESLVYTVAEWTNVGTAETVFFGRYFLRIEKSNFQFDREQMDELTYVYTNAPGLKLIAPAEGTFSDTKQHLAAWATSTLQPAYEGNETPGRRYTLNVGVYQYHSLVADDVRRAFGWVRATGIHTNDLQVQYSITQDNINRFYPDVVRLAASPDRFKITAKEVQHLKTRITTNLPKLGWRLFSVTPSTSRRDFIERIYVLDDHGDEVDLWRDDKPGKYDAAELAKRRQQLGTDILYIDTKAMGDLEPDVATITLYGGEIGGQVFHKLPIRVYREFQLDYKIVYPQSTEANAVPLDMRREKYVIETPLGWDSEQDYTYKVNVTSNLRWEVSKEPASDGSEIDWVTITGANGTKDGSFSVKVSKRPTSQKVDHFLPAREAHISLKGYVKGSDEAMAVRDIIIYQGGYVKIGDNYWLDRNLKCGYSYANQEEAIDKTDKLYKVPAYYAKTTYKDSKINSTLYPYAIPIGHTTDIYGVYALNNRTYLPNSATTPDGYGSDGYFFSRAPTSGYAEGNTEEKWVRLYSNRYKGKTYSGQWYQDNIGYYYVHPVYGGRLYVSYDQTNRVFWDKNIIADSEPFLNPCPEGWHVPTRTQLESLVDLLGKTYGKPTPLMNLDETYSAIDGEMGENNSGRYLVADPMTRSSSTGVHWYLPAAGYRPFNHADIRTMGVTGAYKTYELVNPNATGSIKSQLLYFSPTKVWMHIETWAFTSSVRCVRSVNP